MKKLFAMILVLAMLPVFALADLPDISGLSESELLELSQQIQMRLFSEKLINGVRVPIGTYVIGEDIPAGTYRILSGDDISSIALYEDDSDRISELFTFGTYYNSAEIGKIVLQEGVRIKIDYSSVMFFQYTGLF